MFHDPVFADVLRASEEKTVHSAHQLPRALRPDRAFRPKGTPAYERSMGFYREMLPFAKRLHSSYVVFHHNNCRCWMWIGKPCYRLPMRTCRELTALSEAEGIPVAVEMWALSPWAMCS